MTKSAESLEAFYKHKFPELSIDQKKDIGQFNVFRIEDRIQSQTTSPTYIRRDFYKIMLYRGNNVFHYGDGSIEIKGNTLLFFNPQVPYTYDPMTPDTSGYFCVFRDEFFKENLRLNLNNLPLYSSGAKPVFNLEDHECEEIREIFEKIIKELNSHYIYKYELIRNYVSELIFLAIKLQPPENISNHTNASARITNVFTELLERQFPIVSMSQRFEFRTPKVFADRLAVHVNYLNRAIKQATGRTTTDLISERLVAEAKALLKHTNWNIGEISYALGFEDQAHFNNFFKKHAKFNPSSYR